MVNFKCVNCKELLNENLTFINNKGVHRCPICFCNRFIPDNLIIFDVNKIFLNIFSFYPD